MPYPSETYLAQIEDPAVRAEFLQLYSLFQGYLSAQHTDSGAHGAITAESLTATGAGAFGAGLTAGGDVIARFGTGSESGIGSLTTVNGVSLLPSDVTREGLLLGGVTNGLFFEKRTAQSPYTSGVELAVWSLGFSTTKPIFRIGSNAGQMTLLDGGSGSTLYIGDATLDTDSPYLYGQGWAPTTFAGTYAASAGTWTGVTATTLQYRVIGSVLDIWFELDTGTLSTTPATLTIVLPNSLTAAKTTRVPIQVDTGGVLQTGAARAVAATTTLTFFPTIAGGSFAAGAVSVRGQISIPV